MKIRGIDRRKPTEKALGQPSLSRTGAFTIVELMVALGVLGLVIGSLFACFSMGFSSIRLTQENMRATQVLAEKMETIRLYTWTQVNTAGFIPTNFTASFNTGTNGGTNLIFVGTMTIGSAGVTEAYSNDLKQVLVTVSWTNNGVARQRRMSTLVSKNGIQNYQL